MTTRRPTAPLFTLILSLAALAPAAGSGAGKPGSLGSAKGLSSTGPGSGR